MFLLTNLYVPFVVLFNSALLEIFGEFAAHLLPCAFGGNPGPGVWMFIISMIVYGVAFDFFNISGALFVEQETEKSISASAQGVFMMMTNGFGAFIGSYAAGFIVDYVGWPNSWYIFAGYALVIAVLFAIFFKAPSTKVEKA